MNTFNSGLTVTAICALLLFSAPKPASATDCSARLQQHLQTDLALSFVEFDQNETGGWRALSAAGCEADAAVLIERYVAAQERPHPVLTWHRAQMLANAGNYEIAIQIARMTLRPEEAELSAEFQWNDYVNATIAFLQADKTSFSHFRERLAIASAEFPINRPNLVSVDRLRSCFGKPYKEAYSCSGFGS